MKLSEVNKQAGDLKQAWREFSNHSATCPSCAALAAFWRQPGRQSKNQYLPLNWSLLQASCEPGKQLFGHWRYQVDLLNLWFKEHSNLERWRAPEPKRS